MKYSIVLAASVAANVRKGTTDFPKFADVTGTNTYNEVKGAPDNTDIWTKSSEYFAFRMGAVVFPLQNIGSGGTVVTGSTTFWNHGQDANYSFPTAAQQVLAKDTGASLAGQFWTTCSDTLNGSKNCNMGSFENKSDTLIANRLAFKWDNPSSKKASGLVERDSGATKADLYQFNPDLLMHSFHQLSTAPSDKTAVVGAYCSLWFNLLAKGGKTTLVASKDTGSVNKCTWQVRTSDYTEAPAFKLQSGSQHISTLIHYVEFMKASDLMPYETTANEVKNPLLPTENAFMMGTYAKTAGKEVYLNPLALKTVSTSSALATDADNLWTFQTNEDTTATFQQGSIGFIAGYNEMGNIQIRDSGDLVSAFTSIHKVVAEYKSSVDEYTKEVNAYNALMEAWQADTSKELREVVRAFPKNPVGGFKLPDIRTIDIEVTDEAAFKLATGDYRKDKYPMTTATFNQATTAPTLATSGVLPEKQLEVIGDSSKFKFAVDTKAISNKSAYLQSDAGSSKWFSNVSHVFGRMGQGDALTDKAYRYQKTKLTSNDESPVMLLSIFPENKVTALTTGQTITFDVQAAQWMTSADLKLPTPPNPPSTKEGFAKHIAASVLAVATVASTLF